MVRILWFKITYTHAARKQTRNLEAASSPKRRRPSPRQIPFTFASNSYILELQTSIAAKSELTNLRVRCGNFASGFDGDYDFSRVILL